MANILEWLLNFIITVCSIYLLLNCAYLLFFSLAGLNNVPLILKPASVFRKICVIIPVFKNDAVILETSRAAVQHRYNGLFDVWVLADHLQQETIDQLKTNGLTVLEVVFDKSTKGKALLHAVNKIPQNKYDIAFVLDVDNVMDKDVLSDVNNAFEAGYQVVQTHRTSKNIKNSFAFLDACNEEINNHIYRKGPANLGLSSALIGSGMAFGFQYFKKILQGIGETVGEDKELDFRVAMDNIQIGYLQNTLVFDEKIADSTAFKQQRSRWIAAQFGVLKKYTPKIYYFIRKGNIEFVNKILQAWLLPRMLLLSALTLFLFFSFITKVGPPVVFWMMLLLILFFSLAVALPAKYYKHTLFKTAVFQLPEALLSMLIALFRIKKGQRSFLPTLHDTASSK